MTPSAIAAAKGYKELAQFIEDYAPPLIKIIKAKEDTPSILALITPEAASTKDKVRSQRARRTKGWSVRAASGRV